MALDALKKGHFKSQRAAALAYDISETTLRRRIGGAVSRPQKTANCQLPETFIYRRIHTFSMDP